jgi:uncharacterized protein (TIGR03437 family)
LTYSTYLRDGFTPNAIATDPSGNIYVAGSILVDPAAFQITVLVIKLNPQATQYLYVRYLGGSVNDYANAITVDGAGNAYVAGSTLSPDFPVTAGGNLGAFPTGNAGGRSFVTKLDSSGNIVFSDLLGGSAASVAEAVAVTAAGQVVVSGISQSSGFPATTGAYSVPNTANHPYLLKLDAAGKTTVFSATGIGGSAVVVDASGDIYVAGTTSLLDYPTTPGTYQPTFPSFLVCASPVCPLSQGPNQYVTKVDPTGSRLIFSTAVSGTGSTTNAGLAIDKSGNAYLTGFAGAGYPYSVAPPPLSRSPSGSATIPAFPFLSKLDLNGQSLLFSVPVGGAGVQTDSAGAVYVGGRAGSSAGLVGSYAVPNNLPALASIPSQCLPNGLTIRNSAYVSQVDAASGSVLGTSFIGGSALIPSAVMLVGSTLWIAGATGAPDIPFTSNALAAALGPPNFGLNLGPGAYLAALDFSQPAPAAGTPQIGCILDAADFSPAGPVARYQLLSIFGTGLGPAVGVSANDNSTTNLAGAAVTFGSSPAILLYVSSTQINLAVPLVALSQPSAAMQVTVNGLASPTRQLPLTFANPHLFLNGQATFPLSITSPGFIPLALNSDRSVNSAANPAQSGSTVSVFVNGIVPNSQIVSDPVQLFATDGWRVTNLTQATPFVLRADVQVPSISTAILPPNSGCTQSLCNVSLVLFDDSGVPVSPHSGGAVFVSK